eukprot:720077_1
MFWEHIRCHLQDRCTATLAMQPAVLLKPTSFSGNDEVYRSMSLVSEQAALLTKHRYKLLEAFCQYDLGNINKRQLENKIQELNITPTQAYQSYMRKKCGSLKFNEFMKFLSISDDKIVNDMMYSSNHSITDQIQTENFNSPHRSRGAGCFNTEVYRYTKSKDFLKWKAPKEIHANNDTIQIKPKSNTLTVITAHDQINDEIMNVHFDEDMNRIPANASIKDYCKLYSQGFINVFQLENKIKESGVSLNAAQQRIIARLKIDPNVSTSELYLTFASPKYQRTGNFDVLDAVKARREPLIFVDHPSDIITWTNDTTNAAFDEMTRRKSFSQPQRGDILTWNEISNKEFNEKVVRKKPPPRSAASNSFHSHIVFDRELVSHSRSAKENVSSIKRVTTELSHLKSTENLLKWNNAKLQNSKQQDKAHKVSWERYRHDNRVPY